VLGRDGEVGGPARSCAGFLHAEECGASTGVGDVGSGEACGGCGEFCGEVVSVDVRSQLQSIHVMQEDGLATLLVRRPHPDDLVEATGTT